MLYENVEPTSVSPAGVGGNRAVAKPTRAALRHQTVPNKARSNGGATLYNHPTGTNNQATHNNHKSRPLAAGALQGAQLWRRSRATLMTTAVDKHPPLDREASPLSALQPVNIDSLGASSHGLSASHTQPTAMTWRGAAVSSPKPPPPAGPAHACAQPGTSVGADAEAMDSLQAAAELAALFASQPEGAPDDAAAAPLAKQADGAAPRAQARRAVEDELADQAPHQPAGGWQLSAPPRKPAPALSGGLSGLARFVMDDGDAHGRPGQQQRRRRRAAPRQQPSGLEEQQREEEEPLPPVDDDRGGPAWNYSAKDDETPRQIALMLGMDVRELVNTNKTRYKGLHANAKLMKGTLLCISGGVSQPAQLKVEPSARAATNPRAAKPTSPSRAKKPAHSQQQSASAKQPPAVAPTAAAAAAAAAAQGEHKPSVTTEIGPVKLGDRLYVRWMEGDGQFYAADVTNVSSIRGVAVRYPDNADWEAWNETLLLSDITADRVRFTPGPRSKRSKAQATAPVEPMLEVDQDERPVYIPRVASTSWDAEEDEKLLVLIAKYGEGDWARHAAELATGRTAKACQTRYRNHLRHRTQDDDVTRGTSADGTAAGKRKMEVDNQIRDQKRGKSAAPGHEPRRSTRTALKQVTYSDEAADGLESPALRRDSRQDRSEECETEESGNESDDRRRRAGSKRQADDVMSEAELERLRRQQLRWLRLQEQRESADAARREEQEQERRREEARNKAREAKALRKQIETARRAKDAEQKRAEQAANDRVVAQDDEALTHAAAEASAGHDKAAKAEQKLQAKQRNLMRLMKQLHVDANTEGGQSDEGQGRAAAAPTKFSPTRAGERPQWSSGKRAHHSPQPTGGDDSGSESDTKLAGEDAKADERKPRSPRSPDISPVADKLPPPPELAGHGNDDAWDPLLGRQLMKQFEGHGVFRGTITSYEDGSTPRIYTVRCATPATNRVR